MKSSPRTLLSVCSQESVFTSIDLNAERFQDHGYGHCTGGADRLSGYAEWTALGQDFGVGSFFNSRTCAHTFQTEESKTVVIE